MVKTLETQISGISTGSKRNNDISVGTTYQQVRQDFETAMHVHRDETGFLSNQEVAEQRQYIESIQGNTEKIQEAEESYSLQKSLAREAMRNSLDRYYNKFIGPLDEAMEMGAISTKSYQKWINWIRDPSRNSPEKEASIKNALPQYLTQRKKLAHDRTTLIKDPRLKDIEQIDPSMKEKIQKLKDDNAFLEALSYTERKQLIEKITAALPVLEEEKTLFLQFEASLSKAQTDEIISKKSWDKWIARFKDPSTKFTTKKYFVSHQFPSYLASWYKVKKEHSTLLKDKAFKKLSTKEVKDLDTFKDEGKFLDLHYDKKVDAIERVKAAITAHKTNKVLLYAETKGILEATVAAGYISRNKVGPWLNHVIEGKRTLKELKDFKKDWAKVRFRYDNAEREMQKGKVPQGFKDLSEEKFLNLSYKQRLSYVEEAERRLKIEEKQPEDSPIQDLKGKIQHALDTEDWDEADHFLKKAWQIAKGEDVHALQSMERYLKSFREKKGKDPEREKEEEIANAYQEIQLLLGLTPAGLRPFYEKALQKGFGATRCIGALIYNRTWCQDRLYLTEGLEERLRKQSIQETEDRIAISGDGHGHGLENNFAGVGSSAMRIKGIGAQNLFANSSDASNIVEQANANKNTWSFWYWTNLVVNGVSADQNAYVARNLNPRFNKAARTLEKHNTTWQPGNYLYQSSLN